MTDLTLDEIAALVARAQEIEAAWAEPKPAFPSLGWPKRRFGSFGHVTWPPQLGDSWYD